MKQSNSREWAFHFEFKVCGPEAEFLPVQGAACGWEAALGAAASGEESVTELQRWSPIRPVPRGPPAHTDAKGRHNWQHKRKMRSLNCTHRASRRVNSS